MYFKSVPNISLPFPPFPGGYGKLWQRGNALYSRSLLALGNFHYDYLRAAILISIPNLCQSKSKRRCRRSSEVGSQISLNTVLLINSINRDTTVHMVDQLQEITGTQIEWSKTRKVRLISRVKKQTGCLKNKIYKRLVTMCPSPTHGEMEGA